MIKNRKKGLTVDMNSMVKYLIVSKLRYIFFKQRQRYDNLF